MLNEGPAMTTPLRIGLAGLGTVGVGVAKILAAHGDLLTARAGRPLDLVAVSARSRGRDRGVDLSAVAWEDDPAALAARDDVDLVVEVIGGDEGPARATVEIALDAGKHVVTANKALMAAHGGALAASAEAAGVALRFEAAVAGGIPVVKALCEGLAANRTQRVMGVMNGTCNYILTQMEETGGSYDDILAEAQRLGYAEADPSFDVGGADAAQKLALLAGIAFGVTPDMNAIELEGIERVALSDIRTAADMGYRIKLLGVARQTETGLEQRMQPCLVPIDSPLGQLEGVTNMVVLEGDFVGRTVYSGPGAGEGPTASAVVADIIDIARGLILPPFGQPAGNLARPQPDNAGVAAAYYVRLGLADKSGTLARVAEALGRHDVSIDRMRQLSHAGEDAPVIIVTHKTERVNLDGALNEIAALDVCHEAPVAYRIEAL